MIGFFDSGIGGLTVLKEFQERFPDFSYVYYGDHGNCPYGNRHHDEIFELTKQGVQKLFDAGASIVIMSCNTAIAHAIRPLQSQLPEGKKILGVTIPGAEAILELGIKDVAVVATQSTVNMRTYTDRLGILDDGISVHEYAAPDLASLIERGEKYEEIDVCVRSLVRNIHSDGLILGCTHYSTVKDVFKKHYGGVIIDPSYESAKKFDDYLYRRPEWRDKIIMKGEVKFLSDHPLYSQFM